MTRGFNLVPDRGDAHHVAGVNHVELHFVEPYVLEKGSPKPVGINRDNAAVIGGTGTQSDVRYREYSQFKSLVGLVHVRLRYIASRFGQHKCDRQHRRGGASFAPRMRSGDAGLKKCRLSHRRHQRLERRFDDACRIGKIVGWRKSWISTDMFNSAAADDSRRPGSQGKAKQGRDQCDGDALSLDLFRYRCAATIAGPSGGHHDNGVYTSTFKDLCHLPTHPP